MRKLHYRKYKSLVEVIPITPKWFQEHPVCDILEYSNPSLMIGRLNSSITKCPDIAKETTNY